MSNLVVIMWKIGFLSRNILSLNPIKNPFISHVLETACWYMLDWILTPTRRKENNKIEKLCFPLMPPCILSAFKTITVCVCHRKPTNKNMCLCCPDLWLGSCIHGTSWPHHSWSSPRNKHCSHGKWSESPPEFCGRCGTRNTQSARADPGSWSLQRWWA